MRRDIFTLPEGNAVLEWPDSISHESAAEIIEWLTLRIRTLDRAASPDVWKVHISALRKIGALSKDHSTTQEAINIARDALLDSGDGSESADSRRVG